MQHEVARLTSENLVNKTRLYKSHSFIKIQSQNYACIRVLKDLQEKYDKMAEECRRYKKQCRILAKRLKDAGCKYTYIFIYICYYIYIY